MNVCTYTGFSKSYKMYIDIGNNNRECPRQRVLWLKNDLFFP